jgi:hypothetical protein
MRRYVVLATAAMLCLVLLMPVAWATGTFTWPVNGEIITGFSAGGHRGIDISAHIGDSVAAAQEGIVYWVGRTPRGEPCISIDHPNGLTTTYLPVAASVNKGQSVSAGQKIGVLSSEGDVSSEVPHLHFGLFITETRDNKTYLNPASYLPPGEVQGGSQGDTISTPEATAPGSSDQLSDPQIITNTSPTKQAEVRSAVPQETMVASGATEAPIGNSAVNPNPINSPATGGSTATNDDLRRVSLSTTPTNAQQGQVSKVAPRTSSPISSPRSSSLVGVAAEGCGSASNTRAGIGARGYAGNRMGARALPVSDNAQKRNAGTAQAELGLSKASGCLPASAKSASVNPFDSSTKGVTPARLAMRDRIGAGGVASRPKDLPAYRIFTWKLLPDIISATVISVITVLSILFMRRARRLTTAMHVEPGYCG